MNTNTTYKIRPAGRHILTIGRDLIQDNYAAVLELVKNAYDADSADVHIEFTASSEGRDYTIAISDNGHGMSSDDVVNKWLVPSTLDKLHRNESPLGRTMQGSKGVGRYAASILGEDLLLDTVTVNGDRTTVYLDWSDFDAAEFLDDVPINIQTERVSEQSGTRLTIKGDEKFLAEWDEKRFQKLQFELKKLTSLKIAGLGCETSRDSFDIKLKVTGFPGVTDIKETIEPYPFLDLFDYKISGKIGKDGNGLLIYSSQKAPNIPDEEISFDSRKPTECGELDIDIRVYDRDKEAIDSLIERGSKAEGGNYFQKLDARQILNANNGIGVYRNGFRIRPLGDAEFDWLRLNARRIQNPTRCIGSNQVIGYVQIESDKQSGLIEKSARDGLKENAAFGRLKEITTSVIGELEFRRLEYRRRTGLSRPSVKVEQELDKLFSSDQLKRDVRAELIKSGSDDRTVSTIMHLMSEDDAVKNKVADDISKTVAIYQGQATLGKIIHVIIHEGRRPLSYFRNCIPHLIHWSKSFKKTKDVDTLKKIMRISDGIAENMEFLVKLFRRLDPLAAGRRGAKQSLNLKKTIQGILSIFENEIKSDDVSVEIRCPSDFKFSAWSQDIYSIFTNLIDNSLYWIRQKEGAKRQIAIKVLTDGNSLIHIDYRDSGPGIKLNLIESGIIFEPDFSTKPEGTGLGLAIAGEAAQRNGLELKVFESENGAYFRLQPKSESEKSTL